jgi:hypothetical protein
MKPVRYHTPSEQHVVDDDWGLKCYFSGAAARLE